MNNDNYIYRLLSTAECNYDESNSKYQLHIPDCPEVKTAAPTQEAALGQLEVSLIKWIYQRVVLGHEIPA